MEVIRNFIKISGLAGMDEIPENLGGQQIQYSEAGTIYMPGNRPDISSIFQVLIKVEIISSRSIPTPTGNTIVIDGLKKVKIIYTQGDSSGKAVFVDLELPYNTFFELTAEAELEDIEVYILDAYFSLLDERRIYGHFVYLVNVSLVPQSSDNAKNKTASLNKKQFLAEAQAPSDKNTTGADITGQQAVRDIPGRNDRKKEMLIDLDAEYL